VHFWLCRCCVMYAHEMLFLSHLHRHAVQMSRKIFDKPCFYVRFSPNEAMYWLWCKSLYCIRPKLFLITLSSHLCSKPETKPLDEFPFLPKNLLHLDKEPGQKYTLCTLVWWFRRFTAQVCRIKFRWCFVHFNSYSQTARILCRKWDQR